MNAVRTEKGWSIEEGSLDLTTGTTSSSTAPWLGSFADASHGLKQGIAILTDTVVHVLGRAVYATTGVFDKIFVKEVHTDVVRRTDLRHRSPAEGAP